MIKAVGYALVLSPFAAIAILFSSMIGWLPTLGIFATVGAICGVIALGCYLIARN